MKEGVETKYIVGYLEFKSKKHVTEYCKQLKRDVTAIYWPCSGEYIFLYNLIEQGHVTPESKIGGGVRCFRVDVNPEGVTRFMIERNDGSFIDFSYVLCVGGLGRSLEDRIAARINSKRLSAYRHAVTDQITQYRMSQKLDTGGWECAECKIQDAQINYHVDHYPDLVFIVRDFEKEWLGELPTEFVQLENYTFNTNAHSFKPEDAVFSAAWSVFHAKNAKLQILCRGCNLKRTRYLYKPVVLAHAC